MIKSLEIKTSLIFNLAFAKNIFFLIIDLYFLTPAVTTHIFDPTVERVIPIGIPSKKAKAEIEMHPVFYIFQCKFLAYVFFNHIFKVIIYF